MNIYFISGLGADRRAFERINLAPHQSFFLDWIEPLPEEDLQTYALRLAQPIDLSQPFVLVGLSFGGIIATEIARQKQAEEVILISSISNKTELPWYYRFAGTLGLQKSFLLNLFTQKSFLLHWIFGTSSKRLKQYLDEQIAKCSSHYIQWSLTQIVHWKLEKRLTNTYQIHGDSDKLFPLRYCKPDFVLKRAGHFMILTHAKEIEEEIKKRILFFC